jgi:hypothetical protein
MNIDNQDNNRIQNLIKLSNSKYVVGDSKKTNKGREIRAGVYGGLPFDSLVSDVVTGCLPVKSACYGICFAAKNSWEQGFDFGKKVNNILDEDLFINDIKKIPETQKYLRCGWNSDPSWDWNTAVKLANIVFQHDKLMIFITKAFTKTQDNVLEKMIKARSEMRVSISAMDTDIQLEQRLSFIERYRKLGGVVIPILMTSFFKDTKLIDRQNSLVDWLVKGDYPAAENSLRFPIEAPISSVVNQSKCKQIKDENAIWSGRLYSDKLIFPTTTTVPNWYFGLSSGYLSKLDKSFIEKMFVDPVIEHNTIMSSETLYKPPRMCGVKDENITLTQ